MSASTVSITASPAVRRRPLVASEKKSNNVVILATEAGPPQTNADAGAGWDDKIRAEVLERSSQDFVQIKKTALNSTASPRRARKVTATKVEKPRWLTVLRIFTKNFVFLIVLLGLIQIVRKLALKSGSDGVVGTSHTGFSEMERRISEMESFLKTATKMIQVQVEVGDRKIEKEIGGLRNELNKKVEDRAVDFETGLKRVELKTDQLERSLGDLKDVEWISKQEFEKVYNEMKKTRSNELGNGVEGLDEVRAYAREIIEKEMEKHASDGLGRGDYALASGGGMVVRHSEVYSAGRESNWLWMGGRNGVHRDAEKMLKPSFGEPGQCFPLKGSSGFVQISLRTAIIPEAVTLEHVGKSVAYDGSSAPKDCRVSGWLQGHQPISTIDNDKMFLLSEFTYDLDKSNAQTFNVLDISRSGIVDTIRFDFTSNHGNPSLTCIYRLRVHGHEPDTVSMMWQ